MALDLSDTLVIGISATALFDMRDSDNLFRKLREQDPDQAIEKYREYMLAHEDEPLAGHGLPSGQGATRPEPAHGAGREIPAG